ncbi:MAG: copper amine oxidase N-terminal domain-containing protein [Clostridia bacterium]|nr:copper amine oxidase N-terminal domain-containing protein [Clostridia bacterium]
MNKRIIAAITAFLTAAAPITALADDINVTVDGKTLEFDVPAQIVEDRTVVPMRAIFEALGASVEWDGETKTVTSVKDDTEIKMTIGENVIYVNGTPIALDVAPMISEDRTLVPARAVAESFGADVDWDQDTRTVIIKSVVETVKNTAVELFKEAIKKTGKYSEDDGIYKIEFDSIVLALVSKHFNSVTIGYDTTDESVFIDSSGAVRDAYDFDLTFSVASDGTPGIKAEFTESGTGKSSVLEGMYKDGKLVITDSSLTDGLYDQAINFIEDARKTISALLSLSNLDVSAEDLGFGI